MNEIIEQSSKKYIRAMDQYQAIYRAYKEAEKAYNDAEQPRWIQFLVQPVADYIAKAIPSAEVDVGGPFGLGARAHIWVNITTDGQEYLSGLTLDPQDLDNGIIKLVDYSNVVEEYPPNSLGAVNQLGYGYLDLPEDLDDLVKEIKSKFSPKY